MWRFETEAQSPFRRQLQGNGLSPSKAAFAGSRPKERTFWGSRDDGVTAGGEECTHAPYPACTSAAVATGAQDPISSSMRSAIRWAGSGDPGLLFGL